MSDLIDNDTKVRDIVSKGEMKKMWEAFTEIGKMVGSDVINKALGKTGNAKPLDQQEMDIERVRGKVVTEFDDKIQKM